MYEIYSKLLQERGLTSYQISKKTGISTATLSDWKTGKSKPKHDKMVKIAECLGVDVDFLETGNPNEGIKKEPAISGKLSEEDVKFLEALHRVPRDKQALVLSLLDSLKDK